MPTESDNRYEMLWDCPGCSTPKLLGLTHRHCPNCGAPQDPSKRYFPPAGEEVAVENHPYQGKDKACSGCDTPNAAQATFCTGCGSPLDGAKEVGARKEQVAGTEGFATDSLAEAKKERAAAKLEAEAAASAKHAAASGVAAPEPTSGGGSGKFMLLGGGGLVLLGLLAVCAVFFLWKKEAAVVVTGHRWERTIAVETMAPQQASNWKESVPGNARDVTCRQEQKETKKVEDGQTCVDKRQDKGDGTFSVTQQCTPKYREDPVYGDKCSYTVDAWTLMATQKAAGSGLTPAPSWPAVALTSTGNFVGAQREGARTETYTLDLLDEAAKATHTCTLPEAKWKGIADKSKWKAQIGVVSGAIDCTALQPL